MQVVAAGVSFRTAPTDVLGIASVRGDDARGLLRYLVGHAGFGGAAVLSTCNRTEVYVTTADGEAEDAIARIAPHLGAERHHEIAHHLQLRIDADAVRHVFRVASGLESMVVGEAQVLGQLRQAHQLARSAGTLDARLDFVLRRALSTGKLVRTRTPIGRGAGSLSEVAVECARSLAGDLAGKGVLLLGAGKMSVLAARRLREEGARLFAVSRGSSREQLAHREGAVPRAPGDMLELAPQVDVIISSTNSLDCVVSEGLVRAMQGRRGGAPMCIVDIAVPRDVDPAVASVPGVSLVDLDALGERLQGSLASRSAQVPEAEALIAHELQRTMSVLNERDAATPTITALIRRAEAIRRREVERTLARAPELDAAARERIDVLTQSLVRKLLHGPITHLRDSTDDPAIALVLRDAFGVDDDVPAGTRDASASLS